jgi:hypothetical protein
MSTAIASRILAVLGVEAVIWTVPPGAGRVVRRRRVSGYSAPVPRP